MKQDGVTRMLKLFVNSLDMRLKVHNCVRVEIKCTELYTTYMYIR